MDKQYVLISIINTSKAYKHVKKSLKEIGYERFTAMDSVGSTILLENMEFSSMFSHSGSESDYKKYNKTVMLVIRKESEVEKVMDAIEAAIKLDPKHPGKGIMFTIPILASQGVRFNQGCDSCDEEEA